MDAKTWALRAAIRKWQYGEDRQWLDEAVTELKRRGLFAFALEALTGDDIRVLRKLKVVTYRDDCPKCHEIASPSAINGGRVMLSCVSCGCVFWSNWVVVVKEA